MARERSEAKAFWDRGILCIACIARYRALLHRQAVSGWMGRR